MDNTGIFDIFTDLRTSVMAYESTEDISTPRFHSGIEIHCITAGETVAVLGDTEWTVKAGQVYLVSPLEHHSRFAVTPFQDTVCVIPASILASVIGTDNSFSFSSTVIDGTDAEACYRLVGQTLDGLQKGYDRYAEAAGKALAAWLIDVVGLKDGMNPSAGCTGNHL